MVQLDNLFWKLGPLSSFMRIYCIFGAEKRGWEERCMYLLYIVSLKCVGVSRNQLAVLEALCVT